MEKTGLMKFDAAREALAVVTTVDEAKEIRDKAEAARAYAKQANYSLEMQNQCAEIKIRAERRAGEILRDMEKHKGAATKKRGNIVSPRKLSDLGIEKQQSSRWQREASVPAEVFEAHIEETKAAGEELTTASVLKLSSGIIADKWTGDPENYTPMEYIQAARDVMGEIDLDPASCDFAQEKIRALKYYKERSLELPWTGRVWLNPPYRMPDIRNFIDKLCDCYESGDVTEAILLTNNSTDTKWFHRAFNAAGIACLTEGRISFYKEDGVRTSPTNGQAFFYFGYNKEAFDMTFSQYGLIICEYIND